MIKFRLDSEAVVVKPRPVGLQASVSSKEKSDIRTHDLQIGWQGFNCCARTTAPIAEIEIFVEAYF